MSTIAIISCYMVASFFFGLVLMVVDGITDGAVGVLVGVFLIPPIIFLFGGLAFGALELAWGW